MEVYTYFESNTEREIMKCTDKKRKTTTLNAESENNTDYSQGPKTVANKICENYLEKKRLSHVEFC